MDRCYICDELASSREHVPPRCLFPVSNEVGGEHYRKNLITVPACDRHNLHKSKDDEFLMVSLAGIIGNNSIGYRHKLGKVDRAIHRSAQRLIDQAFRTKEHVFRLELDADKSLQVICGTPDMDRLQRCFDYIARGLHAHHSGSRFHGRIRAHFGYLQPQEKNAQSFRAFVKRKFEIELEGKARYGENPDIFFYQLTDKDQFGMHAMRMCFYGGLDVYAAFIPEGTRLPGNLALTLINEGVRTVLSLGKERYEFN